MTMSTAATVELTVCASPEELRLLSAAAHAHHMALSDYLRHQIVSWARRQGASARVAAAPDEARPVPSRPWEPAFLP